MHQSIDGTRIACKKTLSSVVRWPLQRRTATNSAWRNSSAATLTITRATAGQKSRDHMACMLS